MKKTKGYMKIIIVLVFLSFLFLTSCTIECGIENCHGLEIECGPDVPDVCTEQYMLGDFCRQYASCEVIQGECRFLETRQFAECKECVQACAGMQDAQQAFECESQCRYQMGII